MYTRYTTKLILEERFNIKEKTNYDYLYSIERLINYYCVKHDYTDDESKKEYYMNNLDLLAKLYFNLRETEIKQELTHV